MTKLWDKAKFVPMALIGQIDGATEVVLEASKLEGSSSAIGWLFVIMGLLVAAFGWAIYFLFKRLDKAHEQKGEYLEKSFKIAEMQADSCDSLSERLIEIEKQQGVHTALLQTIVNKP